MRVWTLICLTIFSGIIDFDTTPIHQTTIQTTKPVIWDLTPFYPERPEEKTPEEVPTETFPEQNEYLIRTRVVIEFVTFKNKDNQNISMYGSSIEDIKTDFKNAESIYASLGLKFQFTQVNFREYQIGLNHFITDAEKYPDHLSVYYLLPHAFPFEGLSVFPWYERTQGILLTCLRDQYTLAHEIGHYFGLMHTFQTFGDHCEDTCEQKFYFCDSEDPDHLPNCRNVMNYCPHGPQFTTDDQILRMRRFLRTKRKNHSIFQPPCIEPEMKKMYNSLIELILDKEKENEATNSNKDN